MQPGRAARFTAVSAAGQIGSRTDLPHCTPRHYIGVDGARDWPHQSEAASYSRIDEHLSPCASALSPEFPFGPVIVALPEREAPTLPAVTQRSI